MLLHHEPCIVLLYRRYLPLMESPSFKMMYSDADICPGHKPASQINGEAEIPR
jgi:hypothetical protein